ncbi:hypothetical protein ACFL3Q_00870 [Planctomycetota bacterium]
MRVSGIIHQQICQLKWHLLACLGLIMALPIEEAIVNLRAGDGSFSSGMTSLAVMFCPLLAGLIACAIVQGDLNEKRYIFWRSKPANVKLLITLKFFIGLIASLLIITCPVVFAILCKIIWNGEGIDRFVPLPILIAIMTYSLCFACNVVVRKTARAWLIGMLMAGFFLVLPFILPLDYRDIVSDFTLQTMGPTLVIMITASAAAFVFALYAAQYDWHLKTNLKGLLWVAAGLVFVLTMLFSSQVANIKVLEEKETKSSYGPFGLRLDSVEGRLILKGQSYVDIDKNNISFTDICDVPTRGMANIPRIENLRSRMYPHPWLGSLYKKAGDDVYFLTIHAYYRDEKKINVYEKVYLRSYRLGGDSRIPVSELDLSYLFAEETRILNVGMRLIDNTLVAFLNDSCVVVDATDPSELRQTDRKVNVLKTPRPSYHDRTKEFALPLVPVDGLSIEEKIKLSIDRNYLYHQGRNNIYDTSMVDVHDGKITFVLVSRKDVARFDVIRRYRDKIYCKFVTARPFTIIEGMADTIIYGTTWGIDFDRAFVKNGNLYCYGNGQLMVFDIRSKRGIRKLGHFVRMDYGIEDIEALDNGNILMSVRPLQVLHVKHSHAEKKYLYLLENPR